MWMRAGLLLLLTAWTACGTDEDDVAPLPETPCERLRDHLVELRMADVTGVDVEPHKQAMRQAMGPSFLASCARDLTPSQIRCATVAVDSNAASACVTSSAKGAR